MERSTEMPSPKRKYQKPTLRKIPLRPEEAVLGNCKSVSSSSGSNISNCTIPAACNVIGS